MPSRLIRESICSSETLDRLSCEAERLFFRLLTKSDDFGLFEANPKLVRCGCFPLAIDRISEPDVLRWLNELGAVGVVGFYRSGDRIYGKFKTFAHYQRLRAKKPKHPVPADADMCQSLDVICRHVTADVSHVTSDDGHLPTSAAPCRHVFTEAEAEAEAELYSEDLLVDDGIADAAKGKSGKAEKKGKAKKPAPTEAALSAADGFRHVILGNQPTHLLARPERWIRQRERWARELDLIHRIDGRSWEEIRRVYEWAQADEFWRPNCLSPKSLRKQFDRLAAQAARSGPTVVGPRRTTEEQEIEAERQTLAIWGGDA